MTLPGDATNPKELERFRLLEEATKREDKAALVTEPGAAKQLRDEARGLRAHAHRVEEDRTGNGNEERSPQMDEKRFSRTERTLSINWLVGIVVISVGAVIVLIILTLRQSTNSSGPAGGTYAALSPLWPILGAAVGALAAYLGGMATARVADEERQNDISIQTLRTLERAKLRAVGLKGAKLGGIELRGADLSMANLSEADLRASDLSEAKLFESILTKADLSKANLAKAILIGANLTEANLTDADLTEANLSDADLRIANLSSADLRGARGLVQEQLEQALGDETTRLPEHLQRAESWSMSIQEQRKKHT